MPPKRSPEADLIRVKHMIDAIEEALEFLAQKKRADLDQNRMLVLALLKELEILGEAANQVTAEFQKQSPEIPWAQIISTRNRLIHGYFDVDLDIVWNTFKKDLPLLLVALKKVIA